MTRQELGNNSAKPHIMFIVHFLRCNTNVCEKILGTTNKLWLTS